MFRDREERSKEEEEGEEDSSMSSPVDESYKIRIPRGSLSPRSHEDISESNMNKEDGEAAQDLSLAASRDGALVMGEESAEDERSEDQEH